MKKKLPPEDEIEGPRDFPATEKLLSQVAGKPPEEAYSEILPNLWRPLYWRARAARAGAHTARNGVQNVMARREELARKYLEKKHDRRFRDYLGCVVANECRDLKRADRREHEHRRRYAAVDPLQGQETPAEKEERERHQALADEYARKAVQELREKCAANARWCRVLDAFLDGNQAVDDELDRMDFEGLFPKRQVRDDLKRDIREALIRKLKEILNADAPRLRAEGFADVEEASRILFYRKPKRERAG